MPRKPSSDQILAQASEKEKVYDWISAAGLYDKALDCVLNEGEPLKSCEIQEKLGFCLYRAAMQAGSQEEFKGRMRRATEAYEKAAGLHQKLMREQSIPRMLRCRAIARFLDQWLASSPAEKRRLLDECLEVEEKALDAFWNQESILEYGRMYNELWLASWHRAFLEWDIQVVERIVENAMQWGEKAVERLSGFADSYENARAHFALAVSLSLFLGFFVEEGMEEEEKYHQRIDEHLWNTLGFSESIEDSYLKGLSHLWLGKNAGGEERMKHFESALKCAEKTRDNFLKALSFNMLASETYWKAIATESFEQRKTLAERAMKFYDECDSTSSIISFIIPGVGIIPPPAGYADHYFHQATWEIDLGKRQEFLSKSEKAAVKALKIAEDSDAPWTILNVLHILSKVLHIKARMALNPKEKTSLLEKALGHRKRTLEIMEQSTPCNYWDLGILYSYLADISAELVSLESNISKKRQLLEEALSSKEKCLKLISKTVPYYEKLGEKDFFVALYICQDSYAVLLNRLYDLTSDSNHLRNAIEISQKAISSASKLDLVSRIAESCWKIAKAQDILGEHLKAAESFKSASENYAKAAERIPQLHDLYEDYLYYLRAWSEIEEARHSHSQRRYGQAKVHYEKAADFHRSTKRWHYLNQNYLAWARLEEAEDLSRREQTQKARDIFKRAADMFTEARKSISEELQRIEHTEEKEMAVRLVKASDTREAYCLGRITIEEAKISQRQGDPAVSSEKYAEAARIFQKMAIDEPEQIRFELQPLIYLCLAWQKMMAAETRASSVSYAEAAELFKKAKEHALDQQTAFLALANCSFCKALEAGTEFETARDMSEYSTAKRHMEAAANYYIKAGFKIGSNYAKATERLFDAYIYMDKAETETEPLKKADYFEMAEKLLQASASFYARAKHPEKSEETKRLLARVKKERQFAMSLSEVLGSPSVASMTSSFVMPSPTHEKAVGLEKFEHGYVQTYLSVPETADVGQEFELRVDMVNVAKNPCLLVRVDCLVPSGFEVVTSPLQHSIDNGSMDIKGKKLDPLKVESIKLILRATKTCSVSFSPQVIYLDEIGGFKTCRPQPATLTVHAKLAFGFSAKTSQSIFDYLVDAFRVDYMKRRFPLERSGWRTLLQIVKSAGVSKSSVYGAKRRHGYAISELERRGLVETRVFEGEPGRGGKIAKMRVFYEKETVKRHIDEQVMKTK